MQITRSRPISFPAAGRALGAVWSWLMPRTWVLLPLLALPALWPLYREGLPLGVDSHMHLARVASLDYHIRHGMLYPRWVPELVLGHGYPVFNFYAPLIYYLIELLHLAGLGYYLAYAAASALAILAAGFGMYLLARAVFGPGQDWAALVAATAYLYAPYLLTNVFMRGALPEAGAQALLPWVFWGTRGLVDGKQPRRYVLPTALSLAGLVVTHNLTLLFVPLAWLGYVAVLWWQRGRHGAALRLAGLGGLLAVGVSAFFWLPVLGERQYLGNSAYNVARIFLTENAWTWGNFLDTTFAYGYSWAIPFQLGLVQLVLALAGALLARRRDAEWFFWGLLAVVSCLGIGAWSLPVWFSNQTLQAVQFPWRLLSIASLPLALLTGGTLLRFPAPRLRVGLTLALLALILAGNAPRLNWIKVLASSDSSISAATTAQVEVDARTLGTSSLGEFRPRWAQDATALVADPGQPAIQADFVPEAGNAYDLRGTITSSQGGPLRFSTYYFPGWQVLVDGRGLATYPSTNLGLLTVDVPAGTHQLQLTWAGTPLQRVGGLLSLLALAALVGLAWLGIPNVQGRPVILSGSPTPIPVRRASSEESLPGRPRPFAEDARPRVSRGQPAQGDTEPVRTLGIHVAWRGWPGRGWAVLPLVLLIAGSAAMAWPRTQAAIRPPAEEIVAPGIRLAGYRVEAGTPASQYPYLYVYPEWFVAAAQPEDFQVRWGLQDASGQIVAETVSRPHFDAARATDWPVGTLVRDAYQLPLPSGLPAGRYALVAQILPGTDSGTWRRLGDVTLAASVPGEAGPQHPLDARLGTAVRLGGYDLKVRGSAGASIGDSLTVVHPGDSLAYTLYWKAIAPVPISYHGFVHLIDQAGNALVRQDQLPGPIFRPALLWDAYHWAKDWYLLRIPADTPSGLYQPSVGLYDFKTGERTTAYDAQGQEMVDGVRLPAVKVVNPAAARPQQAVTGQFTGLGTLQGYDLALPSAGLGAGDSFTVTLYYRSEALTATNYTRFVHLANPAAGLVAGADSPPQAGANPTWSWQPGETIADRVTVQVKPGTPASTYRLTAGFYDPQAGGARLPVQDAQGQPWPDAEVVLGEIRVGQ